MKQIDISTPTYPNTFAFVSDKDFEKFNIYKYAVIPKKNLFYARRHKTISVGKYAGIYMHREIMGSPKGMEIDHIDGNGLNNQRSNLRICTSSQNQWNCRKPITNKSGYKGVYWCPKNKKWRTCIRIDRKKTHIGVFFCLIKAAKAYDKAARKYFGEYARTNFPEGDE